MENTEADVEIEQAKRQIKNVCGCLAVFILILLVLSSPVVIYFYETRFKETTLAGSQSHNGTHTIKVVEKGEAFLMGPSMVKVMYGDHHLEEYIGNDGGPLDSSNVSISWESDEKAIIKLRGRETGADVLFEFKGKRKNPFNRIER